MNPIRITITDEHTLIRAGVRAMLGQLPGLAVVGESVDGPGAMEQVATLRPDVALMDILLPKSSGFDVAAQIARDYPATRVVFFSMHVDEESVRKAVRASAAGYLLKTSGLPELEMAVRAAARGETYLCPAVSTRLVADYQRFGTIEPPPHELLTPRQREVLRLIAEGKTTKAIARGLEISVKTVETHRTQLMDRLEIHEVAGLVRYAIRTGMVKVDP